ncbi:thermonuclease family protein [Actinomycetospora straminea]|uniref:TNase-like domain-containing protein n=1 Tax=Actinomycetospora straminea TaxID=663607 RepID=A0ABP9EEQ0_9PSEU|nr:thermonuclease family protein [Actinomycetospora straminea]MDD7934366.1 thermonuclease family protein [Actinomycetospora straminea]
MRQAHVWLGIAAGVVVLVAAVDLASGTSTPTPASSSSVTATTTTTTTTTTTQPPTSTAAPITSSTPAGDTATVIDVVDGDTIEVAGGERVRLLGIDACEMGTRGGREAKDLLEGFVSSGQVRLIADGARDRDGNGRLLRRVETSPGGSDLGELLIIYPTVGVYEGRNDATPEYLAGLRASDQGERRCAGTPTTTSSSSGSDDEVEIEDDDDRGLPDGALTGGYCARKWWC